MAVPLHIACDAVGKVELPLSDIVKAAFSKYKEENNGAEPDDGVEIHDVRIEDYENGHFPVASCPDCSNATGMLDLGFDIKLTMQ